MADSPLLARELKSYLIKFKLQQVISAAVNSVAKTLPPDPFTFLAGYFSELTDEPPFITNFISRQVLLDIGPSIQISVQANSKGQILNGPNFTYSPGINESEARLDQDRLGGRGCISACNELQTIKPILVGVDLYNQRKIDSLIDQQELGSNSKISLSYACAVAAAFFKGVPLYQHIFDRFTRRPWEANPLPKLTIPLLFGGKSLGSKVKFSCFYLYEVDSSKFQPYQQYEIIKKLFDCCKRILSSGKGGESALKTNGNGFIYGETIADCLKVMQDTVSQAGLAMGEDFRVGIDCNGQENYLRDSLKYEMEGFKVPPDGLQLTEYYLKLLNDKPYIGFIQDPFAIDDKEAWRSILQRVGDTKIGCKRSCQTLADLQAFTDQEQPVIPHFISINYNKPVTEIIDLGKHATKNGIQLLISENPLESPDSSLVDLAYGLHAEFLQLSPPLKPGNLSKFNRLIHLRSQRYFQMDSFRSPAGSGSNSLQCSSSKKPTNLSDNPLVIPRVKPGTPRINSISNLQNFLKKLLEEGDTLMSVKRTFPKFKVALIRLKIQSGVEYPKIRQIETIFNQLEKNGLTQKVRNLILELNTPSLSRCNSFQVQAEDRFHKFLASFPLEDIYSSHPSTKSMVLSLLSLLSVIDQSLVVPLVRNADTHQHLPPTDQLLPLLMKIPIWMSSNAIPKTAIIKAQHYFYNTKTEGVFSNLMEEIFLLIRSYQQSKYPRITPLKQHKRNFSAQMCATLESTEETVKSFAIEKSEGINRRLSQTQNSVLDDTIKKTQKLLQSRSPKKISLRKGCKQKLLNKFLYLEGKYGDNSENQSQRLIYPTKRILSRTPTSISRKFMLSFDFLKTKSTLMNSTNFMFSSFNSQFQLKQLLFVAIFVQLNFNCCYPRIPLKTFGYYPYISKLCFQMILSKLLILQY